ncbi:hypothetical protein GCM10011519_22900 [Marmoricola endophyticus]|uniref:Polysaccharide chain length determinant N-terminal domain-containing protein n=1 Tax=Marmoricola endophyticus TaxID=2040280 RepID=A0A917BNW3_9ACTN|nr:Wzz/FepE/Etk N-terminal domain-containing protein [Marmoricola endophyticus]GGF48329.1 hypothetical protein GCM10011519_22900 [Marmoricola endophyticus]
MADHTAAVPDQGPGLLDAIRRSPILVVAVVVVGALLGLAFTFLRETGYSARAEVVVGTNTDVTLYAQGQNSQPGARAQAAAVAMRSHELAKAASDLLDGKVASRRIERTTTVAPVQDSSVVTVTARSDDAEQAAQVANALVKAYTQTSGEAADAQGQRAQSVLARQEERIRTKIAAVKKQQTTRMTQVGRGVPGEGVERDRLLQLALGNDAEYQGLVNQQDRLSETLETIETSQSQNAVDTQLVSSGTTTVYPAEVPRGNLGATLVRNILIGAVLGLLVGSVLAWRRLDRAAARRHGSPAGR